MTTELSSERIMQIQEVFVGQPTPGLPIETSDWLAFARAVIAEDRARQAPAPVEVSRLADLLEQARSALNYVDECCSRTIPCAIDLDRVNDVAAKINDRLVSMASTPVGEVPAGEVARESDHQLMNFYSVETLHALIDAQERHITKLQSKLPPLRDESPRNPRIA